MSTSGISGLLKFLAESVLFPSYAVRKKLAHRYLKGTGLEIGALHLPLETPPGVVVRYVDTVTREENIRRYPHLAPSRIVTTDHLDDGFTLTTIPDTSQDFIIANHLLEHSPDPLAALLQWRRVLRSGGILFLTIPDGTRNFDQGRAITPLAHLVEDYELAARGEDEEFARRNREHYREFVEISIPNLNRMQGRRPMTPERQRDYLEELVRSKSTDPHFHLFDKTSLANLCDYLTTRLAPDLTLLELVPSRLGSEYVVVLGKL